MSDPPPYALNHFALQENNKIIKSYDLPVQDYVVWHNLMIEK